MIAADVANGFMRELEAEYDDDAPESHRAGEIDVCTTTAEEREQIVAEARALLFGARL